MPSQIHPQPALIQGHSLKEKPFEPTLNHTTEEMLRRACFMLRAISRAIRQSSTTPPKAPEAESHSLRTCKANTDSREQLFARFQVGQQTVAAHALTCSKRSCRLIRLSHPNQGTQKRSSYFRRNQIPAAPRSPGAVKLEVCH